jgi:hypothetical protein
MIVADHVCPSRGRAARGRAAEAEAGWKRDVKKDKN